MYFWHKNKTATVECIEQGNEIVIHYYETHSNLEDKEKLGLDAKKERNCKHQNVWTKSTSQLEEERNKNATQV